MKYSINIGDKIVIHKDFITIDNYSNIKNRKGIISEIQLRNFWESSDDIVYTIILIDNSKSISHGRIYPPIRIRGEYIKKVNQVNVQKLIRKYVK